MHHLTRSLRGRGLVAPSMAPPWVLLALCSFALWLPSGAQASVEVLPPALEVTQHQLANGLKVLLHEDHSVPVATIQMWYHVGSKDEKPGRSGFAHMFEHLMFKGSDNVAPEEHKAYVQNIGGRYNATTDEDRTLYFETVPSNYLERLLWMEADRLRSLHVSEANFQSERDVVKEERRVRVDNPPYGRMFEVILDSAYTRHPYRISAIGTMADLNAATIEDVREFHEVYYVPNNATLVVAGDFDSEQVMQWVQEFFGSIPRGEEVPRVTLEEPPQEELRRVTHYDVNAPLPAVILAYHIPEAGHPDLYPLEVASNILSEGQSSRIFRRLVYEEQLVRFAGGQALISEHPGLFGFFAMLNPGHAAEEVEAALSSEVERLKTEPVAEGELTKAKNQFISQLVFGRQTVMSKANAIGFAAVILGDVEMVNRELAQFQAVTAADIQRVARKYFTDNNLTAIHFLPERLRPQPAGGSQPADGDSETAPTEAADEASQEGR